MYMYAVNMPVKNHVDFIVNDAIFLVSKSRTKAVLIQEHSSLYSSQLITPRDPKFALRIAKEKEVKEWTCILWKKTTSIVFSKSLSLSSIS